MKNTTSLLKEYITEQKSKFSPSLSDTPLFLNQQKQKLTRKGVAYIIKKHAESACINSEFQRKKK